MNKNKYDVSVVMPSFNALSKTIKGEIAIDSSVASFLEQENINAELVIVDDCSTDDSWKYLNEKFGNSPVIKVIQNEVNIGPGGSRNAGVAHASGEYVFFQDADDIYGSPQSLSVLFAKAKKFGSDVIIGKYKGEKRGAPKRIFQNGDVANAHLENDFVVSSIGPCSRLFRREMLLEHHILFPEKMFMAEDFAFLVSAYNKSKIISISSEEFYHYVVRDTDQDSLIKTEVPVSEKIRITKEILSRFDSENVKLSALFFERLMRTLTVGGGLYRKWKSKTEQFEFLQTFKTILIEQKVNNWINIVPDRGLRVLINALICGKDYQDILDVGSVADVFFDKYFYFDLHQLKESELFDIVLKYSRIKEEISDLSFHVLTDMDGKNLFVEKFGQEKLNVNILGKSRGSKLKVATFYFGNNNMLKIPLNTFAESVQEDILDFYIEIEHRNFTLRTMLRPDKHQLVKPLYINWKNGVSVWVKDIK